MEQKWAATQLHLVEARLRPEAMPRWHGRCKDFKECIPARSKARELLSCKVLRVQLRAHRTFLGRDRVVEWPGAYREGVVFLGRRRFLFENSSPTDLGGVKRKGELLKLHEQWVPHTSPWMRGNSMGAPRLSFTTGAFLSFVTRLGAFH